VDCDFEARGASDQQVLDKAAEHGRPTHGIEVLPPELVEFARKPSLFSSNSQSRTRRPAMRVIIPR
jgi:predicted small metal-binding protein